MHLNCGSDEAMMTPNRQMLLRLPVTLTAKAEATLINNQNFFDEIAQLRCVYTQRQSAGSSISTGPPQAFGMHPNVEMAANDHRCNR